MSDRADSTLPEFTLSQDDPYPQPSSRRGTLAARTHLDQAIARGLSSLFALQAADGSWSSVLDAGVPGIAWTMVATAWFGAVELEDARRCIRALADAQLADGGFGDAPAIRESSLAATALGRAAMKVVGISDAAPAAVRSDARLAQLGGYAPLVADLLSGTDATALLCVMAGTLGPDALPILSPEFAALAGTERTLDGRLRVSVASLIFACAAVRERARPASAVGSLLRTRTRLLAKSRLVNYLGQFQNDDGSWNGSLEETALALIALEGVGMTKRDRCMARGLEWLDRRILRRGATLSVSTSTGELSATALALTTLSACDVHASDGAVSDGLGFLRGQRATRAQPRVNQPRVGATLLGGWSHHCGNDTAPRCEVTADVLAALSIEAAEHADPLTTSGLAWLTGMQNVSGGFGAGAHGHPELPKGSRKATRASIASASDLLALLEQPGAFGDPATVLTSARVLASLGEAGMTSRDALVDRVISFLAQRQLASGAWKSHQGEPCIETSAIALFALARTELSSGAAVLALRSATRSLALRFLLSRQQADGGFGVGQTSDVVLTAIVLRAFAAVLLRGTRTAALRKAMDRAAGFLVSRRLDADAANEPDLRALCLCLLALGSIRRAQRGGSASRMATHDAPISSWHNSPARSARSR